MKTYSVEFFRIIIIHEIGLDYPDYTKYTIQYVLQNKVKNCKEN